MVQISNISDNDRYLHNLGYQILLENSKINPNFINLDDSQLLELINSKIAEIPVETVIIWPLQVPSKKVMMSTLKI